MDRRFSKVVSTILLVLYAYFFASTHLFVHVHEDASGKIVHSHPWGGKAHTHSNSQLLSISLLSAYVFDLIPAPVSLDCPARWFPVVRCSFASAPSAGALLDATSLRGPPMSV